MSEILKKQLLNVLCRRDYKPLKVRALANALEIDPAEYSGFKEAVADLRQTGRVVIGTGNLISLPAIPNRVTGIFRSNPKGFGFVTPLEPNSHGDLFIPPRGIADAITGDTVIARIVKRGRKAGQMQLSGKIIEILQRGRNRFVGTLVQEKKLWFVEPDGREGMDAIVVEDITAKNAKAKDKVVVEIVSYPTRNSPARGVIVEVLGRAGCYDGEIASVIRQFQLPGEFNDECLDQARHAAEKFNAASSGRKDNITAETVITIDPPDAKDFDDAISLVRDRDNNWLLGVHIADVSSFIEMGSPLDSEARNRGNSVYLPGKTIPMLPELLSNGICSLQPDQKRFVKSVYVTYDDQGNVLDRNFANSVICSRARLTYEETDRILRGKAGGYPGEVVALLKDMETLARAVEQRRTKNGMLHLELPEIELVFDKAGRVCDAHPADDSYPHTIIEMFMVEANEAVASLFDRFNLPFMRRIHPDPDAVARKNVSRFVQICGFKVPRQLDRRAMQDLLEAVKGTPYSFAVNMMVLRSLERAEYSPLDIGHFALASRQYCHFTSPIRRYADLLVHRILHCYLEQQLNLIGLEEVLPVHELEPIGRHISFTEQLAEDAEKELKTVLILQMLSSRIGDELDCVVTGLANFGVFAQCQRFGIEGLIPLEALGLDEWKYNERTQTIYGVFSGKSVHLGQPLKATIASVHVASRRLTLAPAEPLVTTRDQLRTRKHYRRNKPRTQKTPPHRRR
ncbi:MAG: ribonuclease R [Planctomycetota bacterium]